MQQNPGHTWVTRSPNFPNREEGIYPTGPGNEWRSDPTASQSPIDLHLAAHTAEYGALSGAVAGSAMALPAIASAMSPTTQLVRTGAGYMTNWAEEAGPRALRQAVSNPIVQQGLKMVGQHLAPTGLGAIAGGYGAYKILKSLGVIQ
jgi:hypothetical protein